MSGRLSGRVAVITGVGSGIGLARARRFAAEGAKVVAVNIDQAAGKAAAGEVDGIFVHAGVTSDVAVEAINRTAVDEYGSVDIASNNAGISPPDDDSILTLSLEIVDADPRTPKRP
jgi:NAD(P)-dependent dehydrogenase (short-subunit alcohol dehydrogenase family)